MRLTGDLLIENKKSFLLLWGIPILVLVTIIVLMGAVSGVYGRVFFIAESGSQDTMWEENTFMMVATGVMMCCIVASRGLSNTSTKEMAISSLMLPVSEKERYFARFLIYVPMYTIAFLVGLVLVELLRFGILSAIYPHSQYLVLMNPVQLFDAEAFWCILLCFIGVQSFFFLSGAIWPKIGMVFAFIFFVVVIVLNIVLMIVVFTNGDGSYEYLPEMRLHDW